MRSFTRMLCFGFSVSRVNWRTTRRARACPATPRGIAHFLRPRFAPRGASAGGGRSLGGGGGRAWSPTCRAMAPLAALPHQGLAGRCPVHFPLSPAPPRRSRRPPGLRRRDFVAPGSADAGGAPSTAAVIQATPVGELLPGGAPGAFRARADTPQHYRISEQIPKNALGAVFGRALGIPGRLAAFLR